MLRAVDRLIRVSESRRKLLGLDLPPQSAPADDTLRIVLPPELVEAMRADKAA